MSSPAASGTLFASYNVHKCVGTDRRFDPGRVADVIAEIDADVIALQEADRRFGSREGLLDMDDLERRTGLVPVPVSNGHRGHGWHGNVILVRGGAVGALRQISLPGHEPRGALLADIALPEGSVRVIAAHLGLLRQARLAQITALMSAAHHSSNVPVVLMGDLNEWRRQRKSALQAVSLGFGPSGPGVPSFPAYFPVLALDRIVARPHDVLGRVEVHHSPTARRASDHLPIKARVHLRASSDVEPGRAVRDRDRRLTANGTRISM